MEKLKFEKEVVGIYISGHPLDEYRLELDSFCSCTLDRLMEPIFRGKEVAVGGIVTKSLERFSKNGNPFMLFTLEDYIGSYEFALFGEDFVNLSKYIAPDRFLYIKGVIKSKWGRPDEWEFKPMKYQLTNSNFKPNTWNKLEYYYLTPDDLRSTKDLISICFSTNGKHFVFIDDLLLESYEPVIDKSVF